MKLRVLAILLGRRNDAQYNRASREEARFHEVEWDNYLRHGPRGQAEYHHGFEHVHLKTKDARAPTWSLHNSATDITSS